LPSRDSNSEPPYSSPTRYQLSRAAIVETKNGKKKGGKREAKARVWKWLKMFLGGQLDPLIGNLFWKVAKAVFSALKWETIFPLSIFVGGRELFN
jgi:hypothetical protein